MADTTDNRIVPNRAAASEAGTTLMCPQCKIEGKRTSLDGLQTCSECGYVYNGGKADA